MAVVGKRKNTVKKTSSTIREIVCENWNDVTKAIGSLEISSDFQPESTNRWIFRGQGDAAWSLESSLRRIYRSKLNIWAHAWFSNSAMVLKRIEGQLAFDFASKAQLYGLSVSLEQPVALLSAMQHFRVPTRLLDWTYSGYVALYFALEQQQSCESAAVWAINVTALHRTATLKVLPGRRLANGVKARPPIRVIDFSQDAAFKKYVLPDLDSYHRTILLGEPALEIVVPILPRAQNERLSAQQGLFLCPSKIGSGFMEQAEDLMNGVKHEWIVKIVLTRAMRDEALRRLFQMNVHPLSLFPGADGLGQFCAQKAELWGWE